MRGPIPTPTAVRALQGNPGRRPLNEAEPTSPPLSVSPPDWMEGDELAKEFWHAVGNTVKVMNVAMESDRMALEMLSICLAEVRRAYEELQVGRIMTFESGAQQVSPYFTIMTKMMAQAMSIMKEFGMTPAARTRVKALAAPEKKSKLSKFLGGSHDK
jgi:P27 family predicted phage terminase small subunit